MPNTNRFNSVESSQFLAQIEQKLVQQGGRYSSGPFERDVTRLLNLLFPFSVLPGIRLFSSEPRGRVAYGFEMDNLFHVRFGGADYVVIVEAKRQSIEVERDRWLVTYDGEKKCAREQVDNHIRTMWEYLKPIARNTKLKFMAVVVSSAPDTVAAKADGFHNAELRLWAVGELPQLLAGRFNLERQANLPQPEVLRVPQSAFLDLLRLSLPVEQLGHPELASAIRYVDRCRRTLDGALFQRFDPKPDRWVINGSAGMGKSVLLAYAAAVLSSGYEIRRSVDSIIVRRANQVFATIRFDPEPRRGSIAILAMSAKQLENLRMWFGEFVEQFQQADTAGVVRFRPPEFLLCRAGMDLAAKGRNWSALLVDEAHDLPAFAAREIAELYITVGPYLVVACDRHQKLQYAGTDAKIIEGLDFTNRSTRLRQIYRNPAPIYIASLALMFRWFANVGPKVIPTLDQMREQFGFDAIAGTGQTMEVVMRSDAHPANSWCHTVATFPDVASAYAALAKEKMGHREVLWVRFSEEDREFDYEQLIQRFTYHNCRSHDAYIISDKYIKGQDYPIVVIEGFPSFTDRFEAGKGQSAATNEARMWRFRRELYLCASRATTFLYFVCNVEESTEVSRFRSELQRLVGATARSEDRSARGIKSWKFVIERTAETRTPDVFADTAADPAVEENQPVMDITVESEVSQPQTPMVKPAATPPPAAQPSLQSAVRPPPRAGAGFPAEKPAIPAASTRPLRPEHTVIDEPKQRAESNIPVTEPRAKANIQDEYEALSTPPAAIPAGPARSAPLGRQRLHLRSTTTVKKLAEALGAIPFDLMQELEAWNIYVGANQNLAREAVLMLCAKRGFKVDFERPKRARVEIDD